MDWGPTMLPISFIEESDLRMLFGGSPATEIRRPFIGRQGCRYPLQQRNEASYFSK
jgi:hypothetical protein